MSKLNWELAKKRSKPSEQIEAKKSSWSLKNKINKRMRKRMKLKPVAQCWQPIEEFKSETWLIKKK